MSWLSWRSLSVLAQKRKHFSPLASVIPCGEHTRKTEKTRSGNLLSLPTSVYWERHITLGSMCLCTCMCMCGCACACANAHAWLDVALIWFEQLLFRLMILLICCLHDGWRGSSKDGTFTVVLCWAFFSTLCKVIHLMCCHTWSACYRVCLWLTMPMDKEKLFSFTLFVFVLCCQCGLKQIHYELTQCLCGWSCVLNPVISCSTLSAHFFSGIEFVVLSLCHG